MQIKRAFGIGHIAPSKLEKSALHGQATEHIFDFSREFLAGLKPRRVEF